MKKKQFYRCIAGLIILTAVLITGCKKEEVEPSLAGFYETGIFITNEGTFSTTGTVSFFNRVTKAITNNIFELENNTPLGSIVQSLTIFNEKGYIVVNNSGKVEVVRSDIFRSSGTITGLNQPRYFLGINNTKGYVSEWGADGLTGSVKVIDLSSNTISSTITTGKGAEKMVQVGNLVYLTCSGGFGNDSIVTIINSLADTLVSTINVGANPKDIQLDANGKLWVSCSGKWNAGYTELENKGKLVRINTTTNVVDLSFDFTSTTSSPSNLTINSAKNILYYTYTGKVFEHIIDAANLSTVALINRGFYALGYEPVDNYLYCTDAKDFSSNGMLVRYTVTGAAVDSFMTGVNPGNIYFK